MPRIFMSPSAQDLNPYVSGGSEEQYMNLLADEMEPYLRSNGIAFVRNSPNETLLQIIAQSNAGDYDLHLALHSNASPESMAGKLRGTDVYYSPDSSRGKRAADIIAENFKEISPLPDQVKTVPTTTLAEISRTKAPSVLVEVAYHDNTEDADWIANNLGRMARNLTQSLTNYFGLPFIEASAPRRGVAETSRGSLNIRAKPSMMAEVIGSIPDGSALVINGRYQNWFVIEHNGTIGYVAAQYVREAP